MYSDAKATRVMAVAIVLTLAAHGSAAVRTAYIHAEMITWSQHVEAQIDRRLVSVPIDIEPEKQEKPPVTDEKKEEEPTKVAPKQESAPAAAAQAGQIIAQNPDNEVLNFTDNVFTVGGSDRFSGGDTKSNGTNKEFVHAPIVTDDGKNKGNGPAPQPSAPDLSRLAALAGSGEWRCPFPPEADADQVDEAFAIIEVSIGAEGKANRASIMQDPGHGFGREARACALREAYVPALDREGHTVASTKRFRVKFER